MKLRIISAIAILAMSPLYIKLYNSYTGVCNNTQVVLGDDVLCRTAADKTVAINNSSNRYPYLRDADDLMSRNGYSCSTNFTASEGLESLSFFDRAFKSMRMIIQITYETPDYNHGNKKKIVNLQYYMSNCGELFTD